MLRERVTAPAELALYADSARADHQVTPVVGYGATETPEGPAFDGGGQLGDCQPSRLASALLLQASATPAAAVLRVRYPHRLGHMIEPSRLARTLPTPRP
ncbi:hypothetical protein [Streptomyces sp. NPDC048277]|uniref:hypothetical protein n=1 Tax=Streptomyces sp. NPDC048277 TaxID=3155027 RepID=UPI0033F80F51